MASINLQSRDGGSDDSSRSPIRSRGVSSPWSKIVRGDSGELPPLVVSVTPPAVSPSSLSIQEHIANPSSDCSPPKAVADLVSSPDDSGTECQSEGSGNGGGGGSNAVKKPVWSKLSNGVVEAVSPVMGAVSWPALGESTKPSPKSSSSESLQSLSDGSLVPAIQVTGNPPPSSHKLAIANHVNPTSTPNNVAPSGQRSLRRGGGSSGAYISSNRGFSQRSPAIQDPKVEAPRNTTGKPANVAMDSYPKDQRGSFGSQPNSGNTNTNTNDHHHQRNSYRRGDGGQHPRGNQDWNQHRSFNNMQPQRGGFCRGFVRPSGHSSTSFMPPQMHVQVRSFGNNFMYPVADMGAAMFYVQGPTPPDPLRSIPLVAPMQPPLYFPVPDPDLHKKIEKQIEYYFSNENLVRDIYLRQKMDEQGWVPVNIIASFKKVSILTDDVQLILDVMRTSKAVEVQGEKMRRRNEWMKWVLPSFINQDSLASQLQGIGLDEVATNNQVHMETFSGQQSQQQGGFERATVA